MSLYYFKKYPWTSKIWRSILNMLLKIRHTIVGYSTTHPPCVVTNSTHDHHKFDKFSSHNPLYSVATCRKKRYAKDFKNLMLIKEIRRYSTFNHCNPTHPYFTSDVVRFCRRILGSNPVVVQGVIHMVEWKSMWLQKWPKESVGMEVV